MPRPFSKRLGDTMSAMSSYRSEHCSGRGLSKFFALVSQAMVYMQRRGQKSFVSWKKSAEHFQPERKHWGGGSIEQGHRVACSDMMGKAFGDHQSHLAYGRRSWCRKSSQ